MQDNRQHLAEDAASMVERLQVSRCASDARAALAAQAFPVLHCAVLHREPLPTLHHCLWQHYVLIILHS